MTIERVITEGCFVGGVPINAENDVENQDADMTDLPAEIADNRFMDSLRRKDEAGCTAKDQQFRISPASGSSRVGPGILVVPGWIRERAAEVLFEEDTRGESPGLPKIILQTLIKVSQTLAYAILGS
jgi:actin-related protein 10